MPARRGKPPRVVLCATLTVDGKLAAVQSVPRAPDPAAIVWEDSDGKLAADPVGWLNALPKAVRRVVCLGPAATFRAMLDAGIVDELELTISPRVDGRRDAATLSGPAEAAFFPASIACRLVKMEMRADGCFMRYRVQKARRG